MNAGAVLKIADKIAKLAGIQIKLLSGGEQAVYEHMLLRAPGWHAANIGYAVSRRAMLDMVVRLKYHLVIPNWIVAENEEVVSALFAHEIGHLLTLDTQISVHRNFADSYIHGERLADQAGRELLGLVGGEMEYAIGILMARIAHHDWVQAGSDTNTRKATVEKMFQEQVGTMCLRFGDEGAKRVFSSFWRKFKELSFA